MRLSFRFTEQWRVSSDRRGKIYCNYEVSDLGRIRRAKPSYQSAVGELINPFLKREGYLAVNLTQDGVAKMHNVHELVCAAFHGPATTDQTITRHLDGSKHNNSAVNLRWGTPGENARDAILHGQMPRGSRHGKPQAKLLAADVAIIRRATMEGARTSDLAEAFGVSANAISHIKYWRTWQEVQPATMRHRNR